MYLSTAILFVNRNSVLKHRVRLGSRNEQHLWHTSPIGCLPLLNFTMEWWVLMCVKSWKAQAPIWRLSIPIASRRPRCVPIPGGSGLANKVEVKLYFLSQNRLGVYHVQVPAYLTDSEVQRTCRSQSGMGKTAAFVLTMAFTNLRCFERWMR